ncbi:MAG TPA: hypothetical protein VG734_09880 [Lacunisphaera sp.]|nr:hypothetical protein [Lacunisphaera sp.]
MKTNYRIPRTPIHEIRSALAILGFRTREDYDELVHDSDQGHCRLSLCRQELGQLVRCSISLEEERLLGRGLELFNELAGEGHPVVAYGIGRGQITFEFEWLHPGAVTWSFSADRVRCLMQRLNDSVGPRPQPLRRRQVAYRRLSTELLEGVLANVVTAA